MPFVKSEKSSMAVCECACYQACRFVCLLIQKDHQKAGRKKHDPGFEGLIKSKLKVIKPAKHLSFLKQHVKKKDVINVLIPNPPCFIYGFLLVSNTTGEDSRVIIQSQY